MQLTIKHNFPEVGEALAGLHKEVRNKAMASALNKTAAQAKTAMGREIRAEFVLTASKVNAALSVTKARASGAGFGLVASLQAARDARPGLNVIHFGARQTAKGVSIKIKRNGPRKLIPGAFIANSGRTVFVRTGEAKRRMTKGFNAGRMREPLRAFQTIDVSSMFNARRINGAVVKSIETKFAGIFANEARFYAARFNARRAA